MVTNVLWVVDGSMIMFVLGRIAGPSGIGLYQIANQVGALPASEIGAPLREPATAGYARAARNPDVIRQSFLENLGLLVAVVMPMSLGIAAMAEPITLIFLGAKWADAAPLMTYCALFALFDAVAHFPGALYLVLDRQKSLIYVLAVTLTIRVCAVIVGARLAGMNGAMMALTASAFLNMFIWNGTAPPVINLKLSDFVRVTWRSILSGIVMVAVVYLLMNVFPVSPYFPALLRFVTIALTGAAVLLAVQFSLWMMSGRPDSAESMALALAVKIVRRLNPGFRSGTLPGQT
jgi:O-antigen/teichoic acid export membrane protein